MSMQPGADGACATSRLLPFEPARVHAAFADAGCLASWWGPDGFSNVFEIFEFQPQGRWKFVMRGPDGAEYPNESVFLETSPQRIVIRHVCAPLFTLTVSLANVDGQTKLDWHQDFGDPAVAAKLAPIVVPCNEQNLNRLHAALEAASQ